MDFYDRLEYIDPAVEDDVDVFGSTWLRSEFPFFLWQ